MDAEKLFDFDWALDQAELQERGEIYDLDVSEGFLRENRVALTAGTILQHPIQGQKKLLEFPLRCLILPHPESRFDWFRLVVNLKANPGSVIKDLSPREVTGTEPVKQTVKYGGGLKFEVSSLKIGPTLSYEAGEEMMIYYPEIVGAGLDTAVASWNFTALPGKELLFDRPLLLLLEVPALTQQLRVKFTARGFLRRKSWLGKIPVLGQHEFTFDSFETGPL